MRGTRGAARPTAATTLIPKLKEINESMAEHIEDGAKFTEIGGQFHDEVVRGCGNHTMIAVVGSLETLWTGHLNWWAKETAARGEYPSMSKRRIAMTIHTKMTDAIEAGDGERARKLAARHIADTQTYFSAAIPSSGSSHCRRRRWPAHASVERCCVRTALITGGSGGIGKACGRKLARARLRRRSSPLGARNRCARPRRRSARDMWSPTHRPGEVRTCGRGGRRDRPARARCREFSAEHTPASRLSSNGGRRSRPIWTRVSSSPRPRCRG